jgi:hypothetical protein
MGDIRRSNREGKPMKVWNVSDLENNDLGKIEIDEDLNADWEIDDHPDRKDLVEIILRKTKHEYVKPTKTEVAIEEETEGGFAYSDGSVETRPEDVLRAISSEVSKQNLRLLVGDGDSSLDDVL